MLAHAPLMTPTTRLPPQPMTGGQLPPFAGCAGNAALLEQLGLARQPSAPCDVSATGFEPVGADEDEDVHGIHFDNRSRSWEQADPRGEHDLFLYGAGSTDEYSVKGMAGLHHFDDGDVSWSLVGAEGQAGCWQDEEGDWGVGAGATAKVAGLDANLFGDPDGETPYLHCGIDTLGVEAKAYLGLDGLDWKLGPQAVGLKVGAGTGWSADSNWDTSFEYGGGEDLGGEGTAYGVSMADRDGDGANEVTLKAGDFELSSEILGYYAVATGVAPLVGLL